MADFSTYITIFNDTNEKLYFSSKGEKHGYWKTSPPPDINPFAATAQFQLSDSTGPAGSEGYVKYKTGGKPEKTFIMQFCDAYWGDNYCNISNPDPSEFSVYFRARSNGGEWQDNVCPTGGHPLWIEYHIKRAMVDTRSAPQK